MGIFSDGFKRNISLAFLSQLVALCASLIMALIVPKFLGVEEYGYWQLFLFYAGYVGLFALGVNDGLYLLNGGKHFEDLDVRGIKTQLALFLLLESAFSLSLICIVSVSFGPGTPRFYIGVCVALFLPIFNVSGFLGYMFQALSKTVIYSMGILIAKSVFLGLSLILILAHGDYLQYVFAHMASQGFALVYLFVKARSAGEIPRGISLDGLAQMAESIKAGLPLMVSNLVAMFILGVGRCIVDIKWGISAFGELSFSLSILNLVMVFVTQLSMVLFPALRRCDASNRKWYYGVISSLLDYVLPIAYALLPVASLLVSAWLPQYSASIDYLVLLMPVCLFNAKMDIECTTFMKVLRLERLLLGINILMLVVGSALCIVAAYAFNSIYAVCTAMSLTVISRYCLSRAILDRLLSRVGGKARLIGLVLVSLFFVAGAVVLQEPVSFAFCVMVYLFYLGLNRRGIGRLKSDINKMG